MTKQLNEKEMKTLWKQNIQHTDFYLKSKEENTSIFLIFHDFSFKLKSLRCCYF